MTSFGFFVKKGFYLLGLMAIFTVAIYSRGYFGPFRSSIIIGFLISVINYWGGAAILSWGFNKPEKLFFGAFLGGMAARFLFMFAAIFISIKFFGLSQAALIASLIVGYFSFLVIEIWGILRFSALKGNHI